MSKKFWMVWCESHGMPRAKHDTCRKAVDEARRLANAHPGSTFVVLESVGDARKEEVLWTNHAEASDECPF